jgi:pyridoxamine 5'-phosphate oxidase
MHTQVDQNIHNDEKKSSVAELRRDYLSAQLRREHMLADPVAMFRVWFEEAKEADILEPNAMTLATADATGRVSARTVLLKAYDERGFVFFTNYGSRKAGQMLENPHAALLFPWLSLERQVGISGPVEKISAAESLGYFMSRPIGSQVGAWVSEQSRVVSSRKILEEKFSALMRQFASGKVPKPDWWGGYRVIPEEIEFWQGGGNRIHDRFQYKKSAAGEWTIHRLQP